MEFFIAPDHQSATSVLNCGPGHAFESMACENLDLEDLIEWEDLLTGHYDDHLLLHTDDDEEQRSVVLAVSGHLHVALRYASPSRLAAVSEQWVRERAQDGDDFEAGPIAEILSGLAALARTATGRGQRVYCWLA